MIRLSVLKIEGGTLSVTEEKEKKEKEKKDWSWSILVVGYSLWKLQMKYQSCLSSPLLSYNVPSDIRSIERTAENEY